MKHSLFGSDTCKASIAILIKETGFNSQQIEQHYITPGRINPVGFVAFSLWYNDNNKCPAKTAKEYLYELLYEVDKLGIHTLLVADVAYFKFLTKETKAEPHIGYVLMSKFEGYEDKFNIIYIPNYQALVYNPAIQKNINTSLTTLEKHMRGEYTIPGTDIIQSAHYPKTLEEIADKLTELQAYSALTVDIETKGLEFWNCGLETIGFAWTQHSGTAFAVGRGDCSSEIKSLLKAFFEDFKGRLIGHNLGYDFKVLIYELWMSDLQDYEGMIQGIECLTSKFDDTKLIAYLATNNAVENVLGLKALSAEYTGNYAEDVTDTTKIPLPALLEYNLIDCMTTWYVYAKHRPTMIADEQEQIYETIFKPSVRTLLQTELCGMPILPEKVQEAKSKLTVLVDEHLSELFGSHIIQEFHLGQQELKCKEFTAKAKKKIFNLDDPRVVAYKFNPNSGPQVQALLYKYLKLPILDYTKKKQPAVGGKTLKKLINHTKEPDVLIILEALIGLAEAGKILTSFIPAFENAQQLPDGSWRLYGNFNLGGTQSLRLSSSKPNLQQIPSGSVFAKLIKACFASNRDWLMVGSDFDALEDKTGALLTRDPNRLKIYTDGFCGHCLRSQRYWPEDMPDIDPLSVESINSIEDRYPKHRQQSKSPSFALQYMGTYHTLMKNCGFSEEMAKSIETSYHELYEVSDNWLADKIETAVKTGFIPLAFGGRIRTPLLSKPSKKLTHRQQAEGRSAGNAATQSYCILTLRAMNEFMQRVWDSPYRYDILPIATIHDAIYLMIRNNIKIVKWVNDNLIECMSWQELDELKHDTIKLSSSLEIYWPDWGHVLKVPNNASKQEIIAISQKSK